MAGFVERVIILEAHSGSFQKKHLYENENAYLCVFPDYYRYDNYALALTLYSRDTYL